MKPFPKITETEWEVMRVIWAAHPITASEVVDQLCAKDPSWHPKTVRTLLARLVHKKALGFEAQGRTYVYDPLVKEADCAGQESESFVERVFGGALTPMLAHFVQNRTIKKEDLEELRRMLEETETQDTAVKTGNTHAKRKH